jgi:hypothetical protein
VDDSSTWKQFFSPEEAARIASLPSHERKAIINAEMGRSEHAIVFPGAKWDVGIVQEANGTYRARWDTYSGGGGINAFVGKDGGLLSQAYAVEATKRAARRKGLLVKETRGEGGSIKLKLLVQ